MQAQPTLPLSVPAPITMAPTETQGVIPISYVLCITRTHCRTCGTMHESSEFYALNHLRSRTGAGTFVQNMSRVDEPKWNLPIEVRLVGQREVFCCSECADHVGLSHLPNPPQPERKTASEGNLVGAVKAEKRESAARKSLDDLIGDL